LTRSWQTYRHLVEFGYLLMDRALMLARPHHGFVIAAQGLTHLRAAAWPSGESPSSNGVILLSAHVGIAEAVAPYMRAMGFDRPFHLVMYQDARESTERFHAAHRRMLEGFSIISTTDPLAAGVKIIAALRRGDVVAMRADRTLGGKSLPATLLGSPIELPAGPFLAAVLTGAPVLHIHTFRVGRRHYICRVSLARRYGDDQPGTRDERMARAVADYAMDLESMLRAHPYQWSNFYDFWKK
jgi:predicted LPLAT superfamily acyltransferase